MGSYEEECRLIELGEAQRGWAAEAYLDSIGTAETAGASKHRPNYAKSLYAPEHDDIYREFCRWLDQPEPRYFDTVENPIAVEGYTAAKIYETMIRTNQRQTSIDAVAVYANLAKLRIRPEITKRAIEYHPTCYQGGCGKGCSPEEMEYTERLAAQRAASCAVNE